ncbi:MAG: SGNH/GDSL hydrolase family protein [FCB group bacterium]|jgi:lysophospholipase L1-like esterase|nr:SGNH/GDSL hydrolase family protein [FCB group bacterium]
MSDFVALLCIGMGTLLVSAAGEEATANGIVPPTLSVAQPAPEAILERGLVNAGDPLRIQRVFAKAKRGEPVVVGVIGGSITAGAAASIEEYRWGNRMAAWWKRTFPESAITFVNAGIGATGSDLGACRVKRDLLGHNPDFVVVEYAVNDGGSPICAETLEGVLRQILSLPTQPGVMLLYTMNDTGQNTQAEHETIARHYGLPAVSFRDALWPEVEAKRIAWTDIEADAVHPNDRGHAYCADLIANVLDRILKAMPEGDLPAVAPLSGPKTSEVFRYAGLVTSDSVGLCGWQAQPGHNSFGPGWTADEPGATLEIPFEGTLAGLAYHHVKGDVGIVEVRVDEGVPVELDAYFPQDWGGGYTAFKLIARDLAPGKHILRVRILEKRHPDSQGHTFNIDSVCVAGMEEGK